MSSFENRVGAVVQGILADSTQWPSEMSYAIPQIVAQNPVATAATGIIAYGSTTTNTATTGTTFAAGADILSTPLSFTATGTSDYLLKVVGANWGNSSAAQCQLRINLDGADDGIMAYTLLAAGNVVPLNAWGAIVKPSTGSHTVNARLVVTGGTGTISASPGGAAASTPTVVFLQRLAIGS